ncbi:MAG: CDP-alcohol phosphatidyltransferase family protein [Acidimicrobiales bacterium]
MASPGLTYGPTALATPANGVTLLRLLIAPLLVVIIVLEGPSWWAAAIWAVVAGTDWVDGWVARRQGATRSGAFLDPLADKFLVLGAMGALVATGELWWLPVGLIAAREVGMSVYRAWAGRRGVSVPAMGWAKAKTWAQLITVGLALIPAVASQGELALDVVVWVAAALTVGTGLMYWLAARGQRAMPAPSAG